MSTTGKKDTREPLTREPGKSLLPLARVQKILKADEEMITVRKEATFLIALAAEEFIKSLSLEGHRVAAGERRTVLQGRDISTVVRKKKELWYLRELLGDVGTTALHAETLLDRFVKKDDDPMEEDGQTGEVVINEDGTMSTL